MKLTRVFHRKNVLWTFIIVMLIVGATMVNVASASPETYFWVNPPFTDGTPEGKLLIEINIANAPDSYAWEFFISWDPDDLEVIYKAEGDFLERGTYDTNFVHYPSFAEANVDGEIRLGGSLIGDVPWANGNGLLCRLGFVVEAAGAMRLNLFDTLLFDHMWAGSPAPTEYPNEDAFVDATSFYHAGLAGWKLKVNGKSGVGLGLKTTVGTPNQLEAKFENTGNFDVDVQAFFEIRDSAGDVIATIPSDIVSLSSGGSTTLGETWAAGESGVYYITAYSFYSAPPLELYVTIADGFSRALRLKAV